MQNSILEFPLSVCKLPISDSPKSSLHFHWETFLSYFPRRREVGGEKKSLGLKQKQVQEQSPGVGEPIFLSLTSKSSSGLFLSPPSLFWALGQSGMQIKTEAMFRSMSGPQEWISGSCVLLVEDLEGDLLLWLLFIIGPCIPALSRKGGSASALNSGLSKSKLLLTFSVLLICLFNKTSITL